MKPTPQASEDFTPQEKEALKFLDRDFNQSFQQLRHYDSQVFELFKFTFIGYTSLIGIAIGLFQFAIKENRVLIEPIIAILLVGLMFGLLTLALVTRNRVYFVQITRYINEQRGIFLALKPFGFENRSGMYTNFAKPPFFHWRSSQAWYIYLISALNAVMLGLVTTIGLPAVSDWFAWVCAGVGFILQLLVVIVYLKSREKKGSLEAVFGEERSPFITS